MADLSAHAWHGGVSGAFVLVARVRSACSIAVLLMSSTQYPTTLCSEQRIREKENLTPTLWMGATTRQRRFSSWRLAEWAALTLLMGSESVIGIVMLTVSSERRLEDEKAWLSPTGT